jgi:hypothetical protein
MFPGNRIDGRSVEAEQKLPMICTRDPTVLAVESPSISKGLCASATLAAWIAGRRPYDVLLTFALTSAPLMASAPRAAERLSLAARRSAATATTPCSGARPGPAAQRPGFAAVVGKLGACGPCKDPGGRLHPVLAAVPPDWGVYPR